MKCFEISDDEAIDVLRRLHDLPTKNQQDTFIQSLIDIHDVDRRRPRKKEGARIVDKVYKYYVIIGHVKREVCYKAFLSLFAITDKRVKRIRKLALLGKSPVDERGKTSSANTLPPEVREKIRNHILSFPVKCTKYTGKTKSYLDARLSVKSMYNLFKDKNPDINCSYQFFIKFFNENFSLSFGRPQVDCCCTCEELKLKIKSPHINEAAKRCAAAELMIHRRRAKKFYNELKKERDCKTEPHVLSICMDYLQNIQLPRIPVQETFYMRQLTVNVCCIHNIKEHSAMLYLYHEGTANKGPNEVCSLLTDYLNTVPPEIKEIRIFSDNCSGQNKNHSLARLLLALTQTGRFNKIEQFFPIRGHSFLPCDRDFPMIKRQLRKHDRLYSLREITELVIKSSNNNKFIVTHVKSEHIFDYKNWWPQYYKKSVVSEETRPRSVPKDDKQQFGISSFMHFSFSQEMPGTIVARKFINGMVLHTFCLRQAMTNPEFPPCIAYPEGKVPIKKKKLDDIRKLLPYIPEEHKQFYIDISNWPTAENIDLEVQDD
ncbi:uncharacterized protein LOC134534793 [Bacillus rossius redtenbacheri]|uniref:uncharacterized protein LOC134534793 n=1 Tax=Bacillus rossius redtenbacheri TaxID=93214 RepID=UPI002FDF0197